MIEICIDISQLLVKELKLGLPTEEESVFEKLEQSKVISPALKRKLIEMKKFRNVLIHKYTGIIDRLVQLDFISLIIIYFLMEKLVQR